MSKNASGMALSWVGSTQHLIRTSTESAFASDRWCERCRVFDWMIICGHASYGDEYILREVVTRNIKIALTDATVRMILKKPS